MSGTSITDLSSDLTSRILTQAGAWEIVGGFWVCAWNVCRAWRDHLRAELPLAKLLVEVHGERAVARAAGCTSMAVDRSDVLVAVLQQPGMRANYQDGWALVVAAHHGHMDASATSTSRTRLRRRTWSLGVTMRAYILSSCRTVRLPSPYFVSILGHTCLTGYLYRPTPDPYAAASAAAAC